MTCEKIIEILTKEKFQSPYAIEKYFKEFGYSGEIDSLQWDDISVIFESNFSNDYFVVHVDPYSLSFYVNVYDTKTNLVSCITYDILVGQGEKICERKFSI